MGACKYCGERKAIKNSHIIPSFVYKWLKETSPTGFIRATDQPNRRKQDGLKSALLCEECEKSFSEVESLFKKDLFIKLANYRTPCPNERQITDSIIRCLYIIAWRVLADTYYFPRSHQYTDDEFARFPEFLNKIKKSIELLEFKDFQTHLIPCTREVLERLNLPKVEWFFYDRAIGAEVRIWDDWERFIIFIKIPSAIIIFEIVQNEKDIWSGTQIENSNKLFLEDITMVPSYVSTQIEYFYDHFLKSKQQITDNQMKKILEGIQNAAPNCGSFQTMRKEW
ncbi:hypothetical protein [Psychrobacter sp. TB55-MNA-CIBAN-0194]|uniref:hypothetical protein n=1 Tax=Psychrobacter sp. TB55-MNA-CIBAN-0194 TaxID=3140445 RepID=UPI003327557C